MADKKGGQKPKITDGGLHSQKAYNPQLRARALTVLYQAASSTDAEAKLDAQARLYLHLQLRKFRKQRDDLKNERDLCRVLGDTESAKATKPKLTLVHQRLHHLNPLREGMQTSVKEKMARKWQKVNMALEDLLKNEGLDAPSDFPAESCPDPTATSNHTQITYGISCSVQPKTEAGAYEIKDLKVAIMECDTQGQDRRPSTSAMLSHEQEEIWDYHERIMRDHFINMGMKKRLIDTRIAIQKSAFDSQVQQETLVNHAYASLLQSYSQGQYVPIGYDEFLSPTGGLWTLCSTEFWEMNEGSKNWEQSTWSPGGHMRVSTIDGAPLLHLDFGDCSFTAGPTVLLLMASPCPQTVSATCDLSGTQFEFAISFLGNAYVKVRFPVEFLVLTSDHRTPSRLKPRVEFAGVFQGFF